MQSEQGYIRNGAHRIKISQNTAKNKKVKESPSEPTPLKHHQSPPEDD